MTGFWHFLINKPLTRPPAGHLIVLMIILSTGLMAEPESPLQSDSFPVLVKLQRGDSLFDQLSSDLSGYYKARTRHLALPSLSLMRYTVSKNETLFTISARLNLPHSTLATLNHLSNPSKLHEGTELIIPNLPGIYLPAEPQTGFEQLLSRRLKTRADQATTLRFDNGKANEEFLFFPSEDFSPQERRAFLGSLFLSPLSNYRISSGFGPRKNPFSGQLVHHDGLDLVAPLGSAVFASSDGTVIEEGYDPVYGNFIIINHGGGYETIYGHLQKFLVGKGQTLTSGTPIGKIGMSGQTTGPHLHFEIHFNGEAKNPIPLLHGQS